MVRLKRFLTDFRRNESGATAIEYGFICTFIAIAVIASIQSVGDALLEGFYEEIMAAFGA